MEPLRLSTFGCLIVGDCTNAPTVVSLMLLSSPWSAPKALICQSNEAGVSEVCLPAAIVSCRFASVDCPLPALWLAVARQLPQFTAETQRKANAAETNKRCRNSHIFVCVHSCDLIPPHDRLCKHTHAAEVDAKLCAVKSPRLHMHACTIWQRRRWFTVFCSNKFRCDQSAAQSSSSYTVEAFVSVKI